MKHLSSLLVTVGLAVSAASAQQVTDFRKPGDPIRLEIKFDGADANRIKQVFVSFDRRDSGPSSNQVGFTTSFSNSGGWANQSSPLTFLVEATIPNNIATGDYIVTIQAKAENGLARYTSEDQFKFPVIHIRNDRTFVPPTITVTERRP